MFFDHLLLLQHRCLRFRSTVASNWTGTEGTLVIWWQWQEQQCSERRSLWELSPPSSDRIDVCGRPRRGYRDFSSAELITVHFKSSFAAGSLLVFFLSFFLSHAASLDSLPLFWSVSLSVGNQRAPDSSNHWLDMIQRGIRGQMTDNNLAVIRLVK